ncbi:M23 family metallopeptidase [Flavobacterium dankookense]|uniref:Peptidase M23-like protein n=1 Tax=Flavobacterium dankookense TaxID=706186 RepID=A0A4R6Q6W9_9FLAO|nr:M23 family metallopeptidase [Flavobacterium dankookense]TDP57353.1 peptidase M23-like protein [Flavobacterium dankookense]
MKYLITILFFATTCHSQTTYPKDYFGSPLDIPLLLSGNFGELRPNHFHAGLDFKTQKKEGFNVYAAAEGYVSRIKIAHSGYGKAIYITHPNGFTTVYGHLQSGFGKIQNYIIQQQYNLKTYELDINLNPTDLLIKKGEIIAISGNTGGSDGPHLHFEIRDTQSEKIINPLFFGFNATIEDTKSPLISTIIGYPIDENATINQSKRPIAIGFHLQPDGNYLAEKVIANGRIGFGITTIDYDNVSWNANGIFKIQTYLNGKKSFGYQFDTFAFDETRYINALIDYHRYKTHKQRVQKLFMKNPYDLSIIQTDESNGIIDATSTLPKILKIEVVDYDQNYSKIHIPIEYSNLPAKVQEIPQTSKYHVKANRDNIFSLENVTVTIPSKTFYDDFYMDFEVKNNSIKIHDDIVPAHSSFQIAIEDSISSEKDREKMFIGYFDGKKFNHYTTKRYKNTFSIYSKTLGEYQLLKDTIAPKISMPKKIEGKWISEQENLQLTITDDLSGIKSYEGYLNEKWILLEYENKLNRLTHNFSDGIVAEGKNDLKVVVTDNVGNSTIFETHFYRSQKQ